MFISSYIMHEKHSPLDEQDSKCSCYIQLFRYINFCNTLTDCDKFWHLGSRFYVFSGYSVFRVGATGAALHN